MPAVTLYYLCDICEVAQAEWWWRNRYGHGQKHYFCDPCFRHPWQELLYDDCIRCGKRTHRNNFRRRRYCSDACVASARNERRDRTHDRVPRPCDTCGDTFTPPRSDGRYCSAACRQKAYRARRA